MSTTDTETALTLRPVSGRIGVEVIDPELDRLLHDDDGGLVGHFEGWF